MCETNEERNTTEVMNYDPDEFENCKSTKQTVTLTIGLWQYRKTFSVEVRGNISGFDVLESAVGNLYRKLTRETEWPSVTLEDTEGNLLEDEDDEGREEDWIKDMLIAAEIVSMEPVRNISDKP